MNKYCCIVFLFFVVSASAQTTYMVDINVPEKEILSGHLDLGGSNPAGDVISVNSYFIEKNGKPFFPVVGELHFSRYPEAYWEESILKMKAGGISVIASYVFWNLHERQEGEFDWSGDLNLRKFVELIGKHGLYAIVRLGPFCHGEIRNGGIPDWLYGRPFEIRSNDAGYLHYVDLLYDQIGQQIKGLLYKDGGPVIGVQLENEYQHSAAPWEWSYPGANRESTVARRDAALANEQITVTDGKNPWSEYGKRHMKHLKDIAKKHGMDVPLYTATGWGNATIVDRASLPVTAGYAYPFWANPRPSPFYLFKDIHSTPDYSPVSFDATLYPSIPAEIGPGIQVKHARRPFVPYESVNPLMVRIVGSGSNGIGYYMYHGGSTPQFNGLFFNEEVNGLPRINYDFQAPIGQYGQVRYHYRHLRVLHHFLHSWGEVLAPMKSILPETNAAITPGNTKDLRYAVRSYNDTGFVFMINFQDHMELEDIRDVAVEVKAGEELIRFPLTGYMDVLKGASAIFPFNLSIGNALLKSATVQPLTQLPNHSVFSRVEGINAELVFPSTARIRSLKNATVRVINGVKRVSPKTDGVFSFTVDATQVVVVTPDMALNATRFGDRLYFSDAVLLEKGDSIQLISREVENTIQVFPDSKNSFSSLNVRFEEVKPKITVEQISEQKYTVQLHAGLEGLHDVFLETDYVGDRAMAFVNGRMVTDHFFHERKWELGLRNIAHELTSSELLLFFHPIYSTYGYLGDLKRTLEFNGDRFLKVNEIRAIPEYSVTLRFD
jgi:beta-galactosidase